MNILSIGVDTKTLDPESVVAQRNRAYGTLVGRYTVIVPTEKSVTVSLSTETTVYGVGGHNKLIRFWNLVRIARTLLSKSPYEVITSQDTHFLGLLAWALSYWYICGFELQVHGFEKQTFFRGMLTHFVLKRAHSIRVVSTRLEKQLVQTYGIDLNLITLAPVYVHVDTFKINTELESVRAQQEQFKLRYKNKFNVLSASRLVTIKNIPMQLQAVKTLCHSFPHILLHILGDGPLRSHLQTEIHALGIEDHVIIHGHKKGSELGVFFNSCDCFVLTSDAEGYGMVIIEAATAGLPILMTDVGCAGDVIINGKSGLVVPPRDVSAFTEALHRIIIDESFRSKIATEAKVALKQLPSLDEVLKKYQSSWQRAADAKKSSAL